MLLAPFRLQQLTTSQVTALSALLDAHGERWTAELVAEWSPNRRSYHALGPVPAAWMASLPRLCTAFAGAGDAGTAAARLLLREAWSSLNQAIDQRVELPSPTQREQALSELGRPIAATVQGASVVGAAELRDQVGIVCHDEELVGCAIAVLRAMPASRWSAAGLDAVATRCAAALAARLARPPRAGEDWSIELPNGCACELCGNLRAFLQDSTRTRLEWPLAKERRRHAHSRIDTAELPVEHETRRVGRPYTLVLSQDRRAVQARSATAAPRRARLAWLERNGA